MSFEDYKNLDVEPETVRHQMKDTKKGCHIKLAVEFPILMPNINIKAHQYHLACEFYNWFSDFEKWIKEK